MARTRTLAQLIAEVRDRADIEGSQHITDAQIQRYLNQSGAALHALMVEAGDDWFTVVTGAPISAPDGGLNDVELQSNFYKLVAISLDIDGVQTPLRKWVWEEFPALFSAGASVPAGFIPMYRVVADRIIIGPGVAAGPSLVIAYARTFTDMALTSDTLDGRDGWEEWVVWDATVKCLVKEESDARQAATERDQVLARIKKQLLTRDFAKPHRAVKTRHRAREV